MKRFWICPILILVICAMSCDPPPKHGDLPVSNRRILKLERAYPFRIGIARRMDGHMQVAMTYGDSISILEPDSSSNTEIPANYVRQLKLFAADSTLQLFALCGNDSGIKHWEWQGGRWHPLTALAIGQGRIVDFDVVSSDGQFILGLLVDAERTDSLRLEVTDDTQRGGFRELCRLPQPLPGSAGIRLASWKGEIHLISSLNYARDYTDSLWNDGRLMHAFRSENREWSTPAPIGRSYGYGDVALAGTRDRLFLFYTGWGLQARESLNGRDWSPPRRLPAEPFGSDPPMRRGMSAAGNGDDVVLSWTDVSIGRRRIVLGIAKLTSDVFAVTNTARPATLENIASARPLRVTAKSKHVADVATSICNGRREVAWIAEDEVGVAQIP